MTREEALAQIQKDHETMRQVLEDVTPEQMARQKVLDNWTVKDIIAHISAWHWKQAEEIDRVLANRKPWFVGKKEDTFNQKEVNKRKDWSLDKLLQEWEESVEAVLEKIESLTEKQWQYDTGFTWDDGTPLTVFSLFDYDYEGAGHETGHAKQIKEFFATK